MHTNREEKTKGTKNQFRGKQPLKKKVKENDKTE